MSATESSLSARLRAAVCAVTGHRPDDLDPELFLESDLGIDSIKMVELSQSLLALVPAASRGRFEAEAAATLMQVQTLRELEALFEAWGDAPAAPAAAPAAAAAPVAPPEPALQQRVAEAVAAITGHRPQDLEPDAFLESDLGVDSIKMVELSQGLLALVPPARRDAFLAEVPAEQLMQLQTLRDLVQVLQPWQDGAVPLPQAPGVAAAAAPAGASADALPLLPSQYPFLVSQWAVSTCSLASRLRLGGAFDLALARRCWSALLQRHPALRGRFVIPSGATSFADYRFEAAAPALAPELLLTDLSALAPAEQDAAVAAQLEACVNHAWTLQEPLLHRFFVLRRAAADHELIFTNHHLVSDGLGNQCVMREFMALYEAEAAGTVPALPPAVSMQRYVETVQAIAAHHDTDADAALAALLRRQGRQAFVWNPCASARAGHKAHVRHHRMRLDAAASSALLRLTGVLKVSMNTLVVGAWLRTVAGLDGAAGSGPILLNVPTAGRVYPEVDASGIVGCFAQNLALDFARPAPDETWPALLLRVQATLDAALVQGCDRAQTRQAAETIRSKVRLVDGRIPPEHGGLIRAGMKSNLFLPYIGHTHIAERYGALQVLDYQATTVTNAGTLDTVIELFHGRLEMTTNYDANHYDAAFVARVAAAFIAQLGELALLQVHPAPVRAAAATAAHASLVRQVAEEVMHRAVAAQDLALDLEADLGLDSLERIRIVARLLQGADGLDRARLMACRRLDEMAAELDRAAGGATPDGGLPFERIVAQCLRTPDAVAVWTAGESLSYGELHAQSDRLAQVLRAQGVGRAAFVGLMLERSPRLLVALLGILKAGAAYVPLDPAYPSARLRYMLEHAGLRTLVTESACDAALVACLAQPLPLLRHVIAMDDAPSRAPLPPGCRRTPRSAWREGNIQDLTPCADLTPGAETPCDATATHAPAVAVAADDPMVVLYTSGSSGKPKGVLLAHAGYANRLDWQQSLFRLQPGERVALKTSLCFDISVWELLWPLQHGATICPVDTATLRDPWALAQWMLASDVNVMHFVPSLFGEFVAAVESQTIAFPKLRQLVFSGEALPAPLVRRWFARFGLGAALANLYGPTEASIDVSAWQMTQMPEMALARIPIGHTMPGVQLLVLDEQMQRVAPGTQGELWIGGVQLAQGYLNDAERTALAFRPNPFADVPCPTLYRTGDLCVQLPDGSFDYRGRCDSQIKIRGFRVELGEIEAVLVAHPAVREAAVLAHDFGDGHLRLMAWLAPHPQGAQPEARVLRQFLGERLPTHMLPASFEWRASLPRNANGKLDRKALLQAPTLAAAGAAAADMPDEQAHEHAVAAQLEFPMGPAQHWLLKYFDAPYQWAGYSRFRYLQPLDVALFNRALQRLAQRHAALRSVFQQRGSTWHQRFPQPSTALQAEVYDGTHLEPTARAAHVKALIAERVAALRLDGGAPLWHVIVVKEAEDRYDLCMLGHHMISDMLGNGTLFKSLWQLYGEGLAGHDDEPRHDGPSFEAYLGALEKLRTRDAVARWLEYWNARFPAHAPTFEVPLDHRLGDNVEASEAALGFALEATDLQALQHARARHGCSLYTLLLAPLYRALAEWSGRSDVTVSHRSHGRDFGDGSTWFDCVGNLAVNFPLALHVDTQAGWGALLQSIKREFEQLPLNGISYDLVAERLPAHMYPDHKLTPVRVNYLGRRSLPQSRLFEFDGDAWDQRYALPQQRRSSLIEAFFVGGQERLQLRLSYSTNFHGAASMQALGQRYLALMRELLADAARPAPAACLQAPCGPLAGKVAVVTGAGRGIGRTIAARLAGQGARVVLVSRSAPPLDEALGQLRSSVPGADAIALRADVTVPAEVEALMAQVAARCGGVDILVNNAGANRAALLAESDPAEWRAVVDLNLMAAYLCSRSALPLMMARGGGKIVNLGSAASVIGYPLFSAYCASKHALVGLTKALAEEVKQANIQVNIVCPAFVDTRMTPQAFRAVSMPTEQVADVVAFLASAAAGGITGESINIFGKQDMFAYGSDKMGLVKAMTKDFKPGVSA